MAAQKSLRFVRGIAVREFGYPKDGPYYTDPRRLRALLLWFGIEASRLRPFRRYELLDDIAILLIQRVPGSDAGHWTVYERPNRGPPRVLDPGWWLKQHIRPQLGRIPVAYYVALKFPP